MLGSVVEFFRWVWIGFGRTERLGPPLSAVSPAHQHHHHCNQYQHDSSQNSTENNSCVECGQTTVVVRGVWPHMPCWAREQMWSGGGSQWVLHSGSSTAPCFCTVIYTGCVVRHMVHFTSQWRIGGWWWWWNGFWAEDRKWLRCGHDYCLVMYSLIQSLLWTVFVK